MKGYIYKGEFYDFDELFGDVDLLSALEKDGKWHKVTFYNTDEKSFDTAEELFEYLADIGVIKKEE